MWCCSFNSQTNTNQCFVSVCLLLCVLVWYSQRSSPDLAQIFRYFLYNPTESFTWKYKAVGCSLDWNVLCKRLQVLVFNFHRLHRCAALSVSDISLRNLSGFFYLFIWSVWFRSDRCFHFKMHWKSLRICWSPSELWRVQDSQVWSGLTFTLNSLKKIQNLKMTKWRWLQTEIWLSVFLFVGITLFSVYKAMNVVSVSFCRNTGKRWQFSLLFGIFLWSACSRVQMFDVEGVVTLNRFYWTMKPQMMK